MPLGHVWFNRTWNEVRLTRSQVQLGWCQVPVTQTDRFLRATVLPGTARVSLPLFLSLPISLSLSPYLHLSLSLSFSVSLSPSSLSLHSFAPLLPSLSLSLNLSPSLSLSPYLSLSLSLSFSLSLSLLHKHIAFSEALGFRTSLGASQSQLCPLSLSLCDFQFPSHFKLTLLRGASFGLLGLSTLRCHGMNNPRPSHPAQTEPRHIPRRTANTAARKDEYFIARLINRTRRLFASCAQSRL